MLVHVNSCKFILILLFIRLLIQSLTSSPTPNLLITPRVVLSANDSSREHKANGLQAQGAKGPLHDKATEPMGQNTAKASPT